MARYSEERKASILKKLLPPHNQTIASVVEEEGISDSTLYNWLSQAKQQGVAVPGSGKLSDNWSAEAKFAVVVETVILNEAALSEYAVRKVYTLSKSINGKRPAFKGSDPMPSISSKIRCKRSKTKNELTR